MTLILAAKSLDGICFLSDTNRFKCALQEYDHVQKVKLILNSGQNIALGTSGTYYSAEDVEQILRDAVNLDLYGNYFDNITAGIRAALDYQKHFQSSAVSFLFGIIDSSDPKQQIFVSEKGSGTITESNLAAIGSGAYYLVRTALTEKYCCSGKDETFEMLSEAFNLALILDSVNENILKGCRASLLTERGLEEQILPPGIIRLNGY